MTSGLGPPKRILSERPVRSPGHETMPTGSLERFDHLASSSTSDAGSSRRAHVPEMHHQYGGYGCDVLAIAASVDTGYVGASLAFGGGQRVEVFME